MNNVAASDAASPARSSPQIDQVPPSEARRPLALWLRSAAMLAGLFIIMLAVPSLPPLNIFEAWLADLELALLAPPAPPYPGIVVLDINEDVAGKLEHRSPIDRKFLARLVEAAASYGPTAIGIDILVDQPTDEASDTKFVEALRAAPMPVVLAWAEAASAPDAIAPRQEQGLRAFFARLENSNVIPGVVNLQPDSDGVVRRMVLRTEDGTQREGFVLKLYKATGHTAPDGIERPLASYGHPTAQSEPFNLIPADTLTERSDAAGDFLRRAIAGHIVLIGGSLADTDRHRTPFAMDPLGGPPNAPGILIHAHALAQLLDGREVPTPPHWMAALLALAAVAAGFQLGRWDAPASRQSLSVIVCLALLVVVTALVFRFGGLGHGPGPALPLATTMMGLLIATGLGTDHERRRINTDRNVIRSVLARYVPEAAVDAQLQNSGDVGARAVSQEMSFVFSDIAGFTTLCETASPQVLVPMLNEYLNGMSEIVIAHGGMVGGFIGDAVVAFWGAPVANPAHAQQALTAAIAMSHASRRMREAARKRGLDFGRTRIGVHTGVATLGNFGGAGHMEYMAHGDAVNTAARLEGVNKFLGTDIAVSGVTAAATTGISLRPAGEIVLKGKKDALAVLEPIEDMPAEQLRAYLEAFDLMREGAPQALETFEQFCERWPNDRLAEFHLKRLRKGEIGCTVKLKRK